MEVLRAFVGGGEQSRDPAVESDELHLVAHSQSQHPGIGHLPVALQAAGATAQHLLEAEVERQKAMSRVCRIAQEQFGHIVHVDRAAGKGRLGNDAYEGRLRQRTGGPTMPSMGADQRIIRS